MSALLVAFLLGGLLPCQTTDSVPATTTREANQTTSSPAIEWAEPAFAVTPEDAALLFQSVRRALDDALSGKPEQPSRYRPPALRAFPTVLHATLRWHGGIVADGRTENLPLIDAAVAAGTMLGQSILSRKAKLPEDRQSLGLELEWFGPRQYLRVTNDAQGKWTEDLLHAFEPGVEGIGVEFRHRVGWTRPSKVISLNYSPDLALQAAEQSAGVKMMDKINASPDLRYFRFRTRHYWQSAGRSRPVELTRGEEYVPPAAVTQEGLGEAIKRIGAYLKYRQNSDGWYSEEYLPSVDRYSEGNSARLQMHALHGLSVYAAFTADPTVGQAALKGLRRSAAFLTPLIVEPHDPANVGTSQPASAPPPMTQRGRVLAFPGHGDYLEVSSRFLAALIELKADQEWEPVIADLSKALAAGQDAEGRLDTTFSELSGGSQDDIRGVGCALTALSLYGRHAASDPIDGVIRRAQRYYEGWARERFDPTKGAVLARGLILAYAITNDARISDLVFDLLDALARFQRVPPADRFPELHGAFELRQPGVVGVDSAACLTAFADGLALAERIGDQARASQYREVVQAAARFVMQLEVREAGSYYTRSRIDALGGVRSSPWNNSLRADHVAESLIGLLQTHRALYPSPRR